MVLSRLPIAVAPAHHETVASHLTRLANLHGLPLRELWEPISVPRPGSRRRDVLADRLAAVTSHRREHLVRALPELHPAPGWSALRHQPQPGCPRCDARHPGGPVTHLLPHHHYVCTRHRYWIGPPDIDQPATGLGGLDDIVRAQRHHLRLLGRHGPAAGYDAVLTGFLFCGHLWAERREDGVGVHRDWTRRAEVLTAGHRDGDVQRLPAVRGGLSRSRPGSPVSSPRPHGDTLRPVMPISSDSSPQRWGVASTARTTRATAVTLSRTG